MTEPRQLLHGALALIVEEKDAISRECLQMLDDEGWSVEVVHGKEQGLRRLQQWSPEVVLVDSKIGTSAGLAVIEKIRETDRRVALIVATDDMAEEHVELARERGADSCLRKPVQERDLFEALSNGLAQYCANLEKCRSERK